VIYQIVSLKWRRSNLNILNLFRWFSFTRFN